MNGNDDDDRWLEIAGRILDGQPVAWDTMPGGRPTDDGSADALRVIAEVADLHRAPTGEPGRRWGTLAIQEQIGHGTFGDVYRARDAALDRDVALKLVDHTPSATAPNEGRLLARVRHSNVVTVHGAAIHDGRYGIWMEFIRGRTLAALVREHGPLPPAEVPAIGIDVCRALTAVHESGLLHGDIKPQNVMQEEGGRIVVMDFGTGRVVTDGAVGERLAGTPLYLAPEVLNGAAPDIRSDVYSVGVLLYYLLTGAHPVEGSTLDEVRAAHVSGARTSLRSRRPETPRPLAALIERATAVEPSARFESAAGLERALRESSAKRSRALSQRHLALIAGIAIVLLVGAFTLLTLRPDLWHRDGASLAPTHQQITFWGDVTASAVSRDGKFLAYVRVTPGTRQGTIFVKDLNGGQERRIFSGERLTEVLWSHDGSELLVSAAQATMILPRLGGQARRVGPSLFRRSWSPDDARFAGVDQHEKQIFLVDKHTGRVTHIPVTGSFTSPIKVDWAPTGDRLLFETFDGPGRYALWTIRVDGNQQEKIAEYTVAGSPQWSPKGDAIYYLRGAQPKDLMKVPVSDRTGKANGSPQVVLAGLEEAGPVFTISGDGRQFVYTRQFSRQNLWRASTMRSGAGASDVKQVTSGTAVDQLGSISPDGRFIAFTRGDGKKRNVFIIHIEGGPPTQITFLNWVADQPVWSPDGRTIAFGTLEGGQGHVWQVSATGGPPRALEQTRFGGFLAWAPNPNIVYEESGTKIYRVLNPTTGEQWPLVEGSSGGDINYAFTSPDRSQLAVVRYRFPGGISLRAPGISLSPLQRTSDALLLTTPSELRGTISQAVDASTLRGREVTAVAHVRTDAGSLGNHGECWLRIDRPPGKTSDYQMQAVESRTWKEVAISANVDADAERVTFGCVLTGTGQMWVDDVRLQSKNPASHWDVVPITNPGFEEGDDRMKPIGWDATSPGYLYQITKTSPFSGQHCLSIKSTYVVGTFSPFGWSADSKSVYAYNTERPTQIVMIRTDGGEFHPVMDLPLAEGAAIGWIRVSLDGRLVYRVRESQSDVWIARNFDSGR